MKKNFFIYSLLASLVFVGCKKDDGMVEKSITLERVPYINVTAEAGSATVIIPSTIATFTGKIVVSPLYPSDALPDKVDVVIIKNGITTNVKTLKAGITTFPTTVTFAGTDLATLFGSPTVTCDGFTVGTIIYVGDKKYETWPSSGQPGFAAGTQINQPGYSVTLNYNTKVEYDPNIYKGNFVVVEDGWQDTSPGDVIAFTQVSATSFSFIYPTAINPIPIVVNVDPNTLVPSITKQFVGTEWNYGGGYLLPTARTLGATNIVAPCSKTITLGMVWGYNGLEGGPYPFRLKKQ